MRPQSFLVLAATLLFVLPAAAQNPDRLQRVLDAGALRVGTTMDTPVFSMRNAAGALEGFDMDALATLAPALGVKIDYVKMTFGSMLGRSRRRQVRHRHVGDGAHVRPRPHGNLLQALHALRQADDDPQRDQDRFKSLADLDQPGRRIAYNKGGLNETFAKAMFKQATPVAFDSNALATGRSPRRQSRCFRSPTRRRPSTWRGRIPRITVVDPGNVFNPVYVAILLHREDQTAAQLSQYLDRSDRHGRHARQIRTKWLGDIK